MYIKYRGELEKLKIGDILVVSSQGRGTLRVIDAGNMRLLIESLVAGAVEPIWYGYDPKANAWRAMFQVYSGALQFDMSKNKVVIEKEEAVAKRASRYGRSENL